MKKIFFVIVLTFSALQAQKKWSVDKAHSYINFTVSHMVISDVTGSFKNFDVEIVSSKDDFSDATISAVIKTKSIDTGIEGRDEHLRSADFFNASIDSLIIFKSDKITKQKNGKLKVDGLLTMRGVTKPVSLDVLFKGTFAGRKGMVAAFKASSKINRKDFGITWNHTLDNGGLTVGEEVDLTFGVEVAQQ